MTAASSLNEWHVPVCGGVLPNVAVWADVRCVGTRSRAPLAPSLGPSTRPPSSPRCRPHTFLQEDNSQHLHTLLERTPASSSFCFVFSRSIEWTEESLRRTLKGAGGLDEDTLRWLREELVALPQAQRLLFMELTTGLRVLTNDKARAERP